MAKNKMKNEETQNEEAQVEKTPGFTNMFRILLSPNRLDHPALLFGRPFTYDKHGNAVVSIPEKSVKNELKRKSPLMTEKEYEAYIETEAIKQDTEED